MSYCRVAFSFFLQDFNLLLKGTHVNKDNTALVLIGYQNDYFAKGGVLHSVIEESLSTNNVLTNTIDLINELRDQGVMIISTPICFTHQYDELGEPVGILKIIKDAGAFKSGTVGAESIDELQAFGTSILEIPGKRGLDAFSNTELNEILQSNGINNIVIAGVVTSVCIDTTGRSAQAQGYNVSILSDCTAGRTSFEQEFYCDSIFPIYSQVIRSNEFLSMLND